MYDKSNGKLSSISDDINVKRFMRTFLKSKLIEDFVFSIVKLIYL